jgi:hypothetical protein
LKIKTVKTFRSDDLRKPNNLTTRQIVVRTISQKMGSGSGPFQDLLFVS